MPDKGTYPKRNEPVVMNRGMNDQRQCENFTDSWSDSPIATNVAAKMLNTSPISKISLLVLQFSQSDSATEAKSKKP